MGVVSGLEAREGESAAQKAGTRSAAQDIEAVHIIDIPLIRDFSALAEKVRLVFFEYIIF